MKLLVLSDLHICNGDTFGTFGWDDVSFITVLEKTRKVYAIDSVILNGDIFEMFKYRYAEIVRNHPSLMDYINATGCVCLKGNHDILCERSADHFIIENTDGKKIYIEHGHNADFINGTRIGRAMGYVFIRLLKLLVRLKAIYRIYFNVLERDEEIFNPRKYDSYKYLRYALGLLKKYDIVILGHTHKLEAHKTYHLNNKKRYLNSGSCTFGRFQGIVLDTKTLRYEMIKMERKDIESQYLRRRNLERIA